MKTHILFISMICTLFAFSGCDSNVLEDSPNTMALSNPDSVLAAFNRGIDISEQGEFFEGSADIILVEDSILLVHVTTTDLDSNDVVYQLQYDGTYSLTEQNWSSAEVLYLSENLIVTNTSTDEDYWIKLSGATTPDSLIENEIDATYEGYGLSRILIAKNASRATWSDPVTFKQDCHCRESGSSDFDCDNGGTGAISCKNENNGCEVECGDGFFACCKLSTL